MYPNPLAGSAAGVVGGGTLAGTGLSVGWWIILGLMLILLGTLVSRLIPRREM